MSEILGQMPRRVKGVGLALITTVTFSGLIAANRLEEQPVTNEAVRIKTTGTTLNQRLGTVAVTEPVAAELLSQPEVPSEAEPTQQTEPEFVVAQQPAKLAPEAAPITEAQVPVVSGEGTDLGVFEATCYAEHGGTASGSPAGPGSIAVDPNVIQMGTHLRVEGYGEGVAMDTGGAIKGRIIDIWKPTEAECDDWGRQKVEVWQD